VLHRSAGTLLYGPVGGGGRDRRGSGGKWRPQWSHYQSEGGGQLQPIEEGGIIEGARPLGSLKGAGGGQCSGHGMVVRGEEVALGRGGPRGLKGRTCRWGSWAEI
jgi:hypothetical protein